jgi:hypothetical protein
VAGARTKRLSARDRGLGRGRYAGKKYCKRLIWGKEIENFRGVGFTPAFWGWSGMETNRGPLPGLALWGLA